MLFEGPQVHLNSRDGSEDPSGDETGHHRESSPSNDFKEVIGAGNEVKGEAARNCTGFWVFGAESTKDHVGVEIAKLS